MRKKADWLDLTVQFASFAAMCLVLSLTRFALPLKIVLAFGISIAISGAWAYYKRQARRRQTEPKRMHVYSIKDVDEN
ncbi:MULTISPECIES: hypothetical protein [unclassified Arthrobacter]|uniref:hypothetical protein n=1 Tax=unclassified Arthrobacter TaxID=235627 RepID=UPI00159D5AB2|nr:MULTISPECIES: hypothetical protein [unclassified Arthrobacter]MCQ9164810.1 hypothetical protein [Arthrobacter sp. STN4]NVM98742.1 hypothetical protein [Arthrobacter sp. SDTb3-6]